MAGGVPIPSLSYSPSSAAPFRGTSNTIPRQIFNIPVQPLAMAPIANPSFRDMGSAQNGSVKSVDLFGGGFTGAGTGKPIPWDKIGLGLGIIASILFIKQRFF